MQDIIEILEGCISENENISILVEPDIAYDLLDEIIIDEMSVELVEFLEYCEDEAEAVLISFIGNQLIVEEYFEDDVPVIIDNDFVVIQDGLLDDEEIEDYIVSDEICILEVFEDEEEEVDELDIMLEEMTEDLLTDLSVEDNCCHCSIKEALELAYWSGFNDGSEDENQF